jgi:hypothetical protein
MKTGPCVKHSFDVVSRWSVTQVYTFKCRGCKKRYSIPSSWFWNGRS